MKRNRKTYVVSLVIVLLLVVLLVFLGIAFWGNPDEKPGQGGNAGPFVVDERNLTGNSESSDGEEKSDSTEHISVQGEVKSESSLCFQGEKVTYPVPKGFYSQGFYDGTNYQTESFLTEDYAIVDCYLFASEREGYKDAQGYMDITFDNMMDNVKKEMEIKTVEFYGRMCYYIEAHYEFDNSDIREIYASVDTGNDTFFVVRLYGLDSKKSYSIDDLTEYFNFK